MFARKQSWFAYTAVKIYAFSLQMGEMYFTLGQLTRENRKNKPECRVNIWNYYTAYLSYLHLQRSNTESAKLNSNTFDHMGFFFPQNLEQKFVQIVQICDSNDDFTFKTCFSFNDCKLLGTIIWRCWDILSRLCKIILLAAMWDA